MNHKLLNETLKAANRELRAEVKELKNVCDQLHMVIDGWKLKVKELETEK